MLLGLLFWGGLSLLLAPLMDERAERRAAHVGAPAKYLKESRFPVTTGLGPPAAGPPVPPAASEVVWCYNASLLPPRSAFHSSGFSPKCYELRELVDSLMRRHAAGIPTGACPKRVQLAGRFLKEAGSAMDAGNDFIVLCEEVAAIHLGQLGGQTEAPPPAPPLALPEGLSSSRTLACEHLARGPLASCHRPRGDTLTSSFLPGGLGAAANTSFTNYVRQRAVIATNSHERCLASPFHYVPGTDGGRQHMRVGFAAEREFEALHSLYAPCFGSFRRARYGTVAPADQRDLQSSENVTVPAAWLEALAASGKPTTSSAAPAFDPDAILRCHLNAPTACPIGTGWGCSTCCGNISALAGSPPLPFLPKGRQQVHQPPRSDFYSLLPQEYDIVSAALAAGLLSGINRPADPVMPIVLFNPLFVAYRYSFHPLDASRLTELLARPSEAVVAHFDQMARDTLTQAIAADTGRGGRPGAPGVWPVKGVHLNKALSDRLTVKKPRLIMDFKRHLNRHLASWEMNYVTVGEMLLSVRPGTVVASVDISSAFHLVRLGLKDQQYCGLRWPRSGDPSTPLSDWMELVFTRCTFGLSHMPALFSTISAEKCETLVRRVTVYSAPGGVRFYAYMDDIFIFANDTATCNAALADLEAYCAEIGAPLNDKRRPPLTRGIELLGLVLDTEAMTIRLPDAKRHNTLYLTSLGLIAAAEALSMPRNFVEKLAGKLEHACCVVRGGRLHMGSLYSSLWAVGSESHIDLSACVADLEWWMGRLASEEGSTSRLLTIAPGAAAGLGLTTRSDASGTIGGGLLVGNCLGMWCRWTADTASQSTIGSKEFFPYAAFEARYGHLLCGLLTHMTSDNLGNCYSMNKGASRDRDVAPMLRSFLEVSAEHGHETVAGFLPREANTSSDAVSKSLTLAPALAAMGASFVAVA